MSNRVIIVQLITVLFLVAFVVGCQNNVLEVNQDDRFIGVELMSTSDYEIHTFHYSGKVIIGPNAGSKSFIAAINQIWNVEELEKYFLDNPFIYECFSHNIIEFTIDHGDVDLRQIFTEDFFKERYLVSVFSMGGNGKRFVEVGVDGTMYADDPCTYYHQELKENEYNTSMPMIGWHYLFEFPQSFPREILDMNITGIHDDCECDWSNMRNSNIIKHYYGDSVVTIVK